MPDPLCPKLTSCLGREPQPSFPRRAPIHAWITKIVPGAPQSPQRFVLSTDRYTHFWDGGSYIPGASLKDDLSPLTLSLFPSGREDRYASHLVSGVLGLEPRALCMLGKYLTSQVTLPDDVCLFLMQDLPYLVQVNPDLTILLLQPECWDDIMPGTSTLESGWPVPWLSGNLKGQQEWGQFSIERLSNLIPKSLGTDTPNHGRAFA